MNATVVLSCLLAMGLIVVASIASIILSARRPRGVAAGRCSDDATAIAVIVATSTAASASAASCSASSSGSCS